jgi:diketogulonate reductase-like aldo/keto reductase
MSLSVVRSFIFVNNAMAPPIALLNDGGDPVYSVAVPRYNKSEGDTVEVPALCFGLYQVPDDVEGERIVVDAIVKAGYRNLDSAAVYGNEKTVGRALATCQREGGIQRSQLFLATKVWNDAQILGRSAVRRSVEQSIQDLNCNGYLDLCYIHWPVPGYFVDTYLELQLLKKEGKIRHLGMSNFTADEYKHLMSSYGVHAKPLINQFEISPFMYRPKSIEYFQGQGILVAASKALHRATESDNEGNVVNTIAKSHNVSFAQIMLRWGFQKGLMVLAKSSNLQRMRDNRDILRFSITDLEMQKLDSLTSAKDLQDRVKRETESKGWKE